MKKLSCIALFCLSVLCAKENFLFEAGQINYDVKEHLFTANSLVDLLLGPISLQTKGLCTCQFTQEKPSLASLKKLQTKSITSLGLCLENGLFCHIIAPSGILLENNCCTACRTDEKPVHLSLDGFSIEGQSFCFLLDATTSFFAKKLSVEGPARIFFSIGDSLYQALCQLAEYDLATKTMTLSGNSSESILVWDRGCACRFEKLIASASGWKAEGPVHFCLKEEAKKDFAKQADALIKYKKKG